MPPKWKRDEALWKVAELAFVSVVGPVLVALILSGTVRDEVDRMVSIQVQMQQRQNVTVNVGQQVPVEVTKAIDELAKENGNEDAVKLAQPFAVGPTKAPATSREIFEKRAPEIEERVQKRLKEKFPDHPELVQQAVVSYVEGQRHNLAEQYKAALVERVSRDGTVWEPKRTPDRRPR